MGVPNLRFDEPLAMGAIPGTNRLVIAERQGKVFTFENDQNTADNPFYGRG